MAGKVRACSHCEGRHRDPTAKEERWTELYVSTLSTSQATIGAYPRTSKKNAACHGYQILRRPAVECLVQRQRQKITQRTGITTDYVMARLNAIESIDVSELLDDGRNLKPISEWPPKLRQVIAGLEVEEETQHRGRLSKVKLPDRVRTLELMGKHLGMFVDVHRHEGELSLGKLMEMGRERAKRKDDD